MHFARDNTKVNLPLYPQEASPEIELVNTVKVTSRVSESGEDVTRVRREQQSSEVLVLVEEPAVHCFQFSPSHRDARKPLSSGAVSMTT